MDEGLFGHVRMGQGKAGFTYPAALLMVVVTSVALMGATRYWSTIMIRDKEAELLFNGHCIMRAVGRYYKASPEGSPAYPRSLSHLLRDPRSAVPRRHLRRIYPDPMSPDGSWRLILDAGGGIKGVASRSRSAPLKQDRFPEDLTHFKRKKHYSDWTFVYQSGKEGG